MIVTEEFMSLFVKTTEIYCVEEGGDSVGETGE